jgi:hypothetical protein
LTEYLPKPLKNNFDRPWTTLWAIRSGFSSEECIFIQNRKFHPEVMPLLQDENRTPELLEKETSF